VNSGAGDLPPGQVWGKKFVVYGALGIPTVDIEKWKLTITGLVDRALEYSYDQLLAMEQKRYDKSFHCLLPSSVVYANPEPKEIKDLRVGDMIIGRDGRKHPIRRIIQRHHNGPVVGIKATYLPPVKMTPDHAVLVVKGHQGSGKFKSKRRLKTFRYDPSPNWIAASEVRVGDYVFFPKYDYTSRRRFVWIGNQRFGIDTRLAHVLGWYVAEGSWADSTGRNVAFSLSSKEPEHVSQLQDALQELFGARTSVYGNKSGTLSKVVITSSRVQGLATTLKFWCGDDAESKKIPDFILNAAHDVLQTFLLSYFQGDGYSPVYKGKINRRMDVIDITTSSRVLAYQLILAFSKLGMPAEMVNHPGSVRDSYSVRVRGEKVRTLLSDLPTFSKINKFHYWETQEGFYYSIRKVWQEQFEGIVYDFQAPSFTMLAPFVAQDCVTRWSIKDVQWEGVPIAVLASSAGVRSEAKWVMFSCVDRYSAPVPIVDALVEDAIIALKINGEPLSIQQGYPARPFFPSLYGWKSAKWLTGIEFMPQYRDGFWEMYGYHERANIWEEERFKGGSGKAVKRTAFGTAG
jgi:DMSO/TMAO reductase YedYZ molybdopterin-dependent catalytic subunit